MTLFDQEPDADERPPNVERAPSERDPALRALRHIGSNAVPVLVHRLIEPPLWKPSDRFKEWLEWKWDQVRSRRAIPRPSPPNYCSQFQRARKMAAAFTLLALGTNANAGFKCAMEACKVTPSIASNEPPFQFVFMAVAKAGRSLPLGREQIIDEITAAMNHTNALYRGLAASVTRAVGNPYPPAWKDILGRLTQDVDANVRREALWSLGIIAKGDDDVVRLADAALRDAKNSAPVRAVAPERLKFIDVVTSSHNHTDHLDPETLVPLLRGNSNLELIIPEANREFVVDRLQVPAELPRGLDAGQFTTVAGFKIHAVPA